MTKKELVSGGLIAMLILSGLVVSRSIVYAEDSQNGGDQLDGYVSSSSTEEQQLEEQDQQNDEDIQVEDNLGDHLQSVNFKLDTVPEFSASDLNTYGDVINALQTYGTTLDQIIAQTNVSSTVSGLSDQEMLLLNTIFSKHERSFVQSAARAKEIKDQIQTISAVLQPLASSPISPLLKNPLVSVLNDFKDEIRNLNELEQDSYDILGGELSN